MKNKELADIFDRWADILEFMGDNPYHVRAYRNAARLIRDLSEDIEILAKEGRLTSLPGIGQRLQAKILEFLRTGKISEFEKLKHQVPDTIFTLLDIPGVEVYGGELKEEDNIYYIVVVLDGESYEELEAMESQIKRLEGVLQLSIVEAHFLDEFEKIEKGEVVPPNPFHGIKKAEKMAEKMWFGEGEDGEEGDEN
jgi:DNA polymerase/3'-5' exonuclease PolX